MTLNLTALLAALIVCSTVLGQVKTKTYLSGIPKETPHYKHLNSKEIELVPPIEFNQLKERKDSSEGIVELIYNFAFPLIKKIDLLTVSRKELTGEDIRFSSTLMVPGALNLSIKFGKFKLSDNAVLSIFNERELTDSITSKENNLRSTWSSRVYQGNKVTIVLSVPAKELNNNDLVVDIVYCGYKPFGVVELIGSPGSSDPDGCQINAACSQGNGWNNEKNSVAIIQSGESNWSGALIMNTCGNNIPYVLTADHCLQAVPNTNDWTFQFFFYSTACNTNTGYREDVQFYGATLKANNAATDFALVKLNQDIPSNSGIYFAGWSRDPPDIPGANTTILHHPKGDVQKISRDNGPPSNSVLGTVNSWKLTLDAGGKNNGSSGSPFFNANHKIVAQLYGAASTNPCHPDVWGGRFYDSWTGGGTNSTRLSNWLDPIGTNGMNLTTTSVASLFPSSLSLSITGGLSQICTGSATYTLNGAPSGMSIVWTVSNPTIASLSTSGNQATVTRISDGDIDLVATVGSNLCAANNVVGKHLQLGAYANFQVPIQGPTMVPLSYAGYYSLDLGSYSGITDINWAWPSGWICHTGCSSSPYAILRSPSTASTGNINATFTSCGVTNIQSSKFVAWGYGGPSYKIAPNPASDEIKIELLTSADKRGTPDPIKQVEILDRFGKVSLRFNLEKNILKTITLPVKSLPNDIYFVRIFNGKQWKVEKLVVQH